MSDLRGRLYAYLQLARPANVVTAWADILGGAAAAYAITSSPWDGETVGWLILSTTGLYAGGVVLNDVFDAPLDAVERPERPIPSGRASRRGAALFGALLLGLGIAAALAANAAAGMIALSVAALAVVYDRWAKHDDVWGPTAMGACRGGNLLLGVGAVPSALAALAPLALIPVVYIGAITMVSRGEVYGGGRRTGWGAVVMLVAVGVAMVALGLLPAYDWIRALPFIALWAWQVGPPFVRAARDPHAELVRAAVRAGVVSLVLLDASLAAGFGGWLVGGLVLALAPLSYGLARAFAVT